MTPASFRPSGRNEVVIEILAYQDRCPKGILNSPHMGGPMSFSSLIQLIMLMEGLMDGANYPQRSEEPRVFYKKEMQQIPAVGSGAKPLATFRVSVLFRQNASWQGTLLWTDRAVDAQFRSVLELIRLLDSALTEGLEEKL